MRDDLVGETNEDELDLESFEMQEYFNLFLEYEQMETELTSSGIGLTWDARPFSVKAGAF